MLVSGRVFFIGAGLGDGTSMVLQVILFVPPDLFKLFIVSEIIIFCASRSRNLA